MSEDKLKENVAIAVAVSAGMELARGNANRTRSAWGRVGSFFASVLGGTLVLTAMDKVIDLFVRKTHETFSPDVNTPFISNGPTFAANDEHKTSWAQDVAQEKASCSSCRQRL